MSHEGARQKPKERRFWITGRVFNALSDSFYRQARIRKPRHVLEWLVTRHGLLEGSFRLSLRARDHDDEARVIVRKLTHFRSPDCLDDGQSVNITIFFSLHNGYKCIQQGRIRKSHHQLDRRGSFGTCCSTEVLLYRRSSILSLFPRQWSESDHFRSTSCRTSACAKLSFIIFFASIYFTRMAR